MAYPRLVLTQDALGQHRLQALKTWFLQFEIVRHLLHKFRKLEEKAPKMYRENTDPIHEHNFFPNHPLMFWVVYIFIFITMSLSGFIPFAVLLGYFGIMYLAELCQWEPETEDEKELVGMAVLEKIDRKQELASENPIATIYKFMTQHDELEG